MKVLRMFALVFLLIGAQVVGGQLPGALGQLEPGQYKAYEQQLVDGEMSVEEYLMEIEERDRPPWVKYVWVLRQMREAKYTRLKQGDLYSMLIGNIERLVYAYRNSRATLIEKPRGNFVSGRMNNINEFTIQIFALIEQYCQSFLKS